MEQSEVKNVNFPGIGQKVELIIYMKEISDPYLFNQIYCIKEEQSIYYIYDLMIEDMMLDDPYPERLEFAFIGELEALCLKEAAIKLKRIFDDVGSMENNQAYISHALWPEFILKATKAIEILILPK